MAGDITRDIPLPVAREVRQRCGFGCVICGLPLYEYEHLLGYEEMKKQGKDPHIAAEITLLCDTHHREKTSRLLPLADVLAADKDPYNLRAGSSKPYDLHYSGTECEVVIGGNRFTTIDAGYGTIMVPLSVDNTPLLAFILAEGHLLLNLNVFDEYNERVLQIRNNALVYSVSPWDIDFVGRRLVIREAARQFLLDITFEVPNRIVVNRGRFLRNGVELIIQPDHILLTNNSMLFTGCGANNVPGGLIIGPHDNSLQCLMQIDSIPRYLGDRTAASKWAKEYLSQRVEWKQE